MKVVKSSYRQTEMDQTRIQSFTQVAELPYMSKRFALKRYLGLTEEEMARNADLWAEENNVPQRKQSKNETYAKRKCTAPKRSI